MAQGYSARQRWLRILLGGIVPGLVGAAAGSLLFPDGAAQSPALLRELPPRYDQASAALTTRLRARFPEGTPENRVIVALVAQGFTISPPARTADWKHSGMPCTEIARIWWSAAEGKLTRIEGLRNTICP